jgi:O-antigen/teichoic acid export membrane protein
LVKPALSVARRLSTFAIGVTSVREAAPILFSYRLASLAVSFGFSVIVARTLGPYDKGIYNAVLLIPGLYINLFSFGIGDGTFFYQAKGQCTTATAYTHTCIVTLLTGALALGLGTTVGQPLLVRVFPNVPAPWLVLGLLLGFLSLHGILSNSVLMGTGRPQPTYLLPLVQQIVTAAGALIAFALGLRVEALLVVTLLSTFLIQALYYVFLRAVDRLSWAPSRGVFWKSFVFGLPLYVASLVSFLHSRADQFLISSVLSPADLGQYALAVSIAELLYSLDLPVITAAQYEVAQRLGRQSLELVHRTTHLIVIVQFVACTLLGLLAYWGIPLVYGSAYQPAVSALLIYLPAVFFWSTGRAVGQDIGFQRGRTDLVLLRNTVTLAANLALNYCLTMRMGINGAALASTLSYGLMMAISTWMHCRLGRVSVRKALVPTCSDLQMAIALVRSTLLNR